jgi:hypothetical protein
MAAMIWLGWLNGYKDQVDAWRQKLIDAYDSHEEARNLLDHLVTSKNLDQFVVQIKANREALLTLCRAPETSPRK